jgi:osmoprotectant transport system permease protein
VSAPVGESAPVIPDFGTSSDCIRENRLFCPDWVRDNWDGVLGPALVQHVELTAIAVGIGFVIAFAAALLTYRVPRLELPLGGFAALLFTIPSLALFQLLVPITGLTRATVEVALVGYTLLVLYRNILTGLRSAPAEVLEAAYGMGLTRTQVMRRIELPLALPAIIAGIRLATVSTIALATVAAFVIPEGLGRPIFIALRTYFKTEFIVAGVLAVVLGLAADAALVLLQRALTPWARARGAS